MSEPTRARLHRLKEFSRKVVRGLFTHHAFDHAATMSFYFFLGMIPLFVVAGLLFARMLEGHGTEELAIPLSHILPPVAIDLLRDELKAIRSADTASVAPLSILGFLWLTTNGVHNLMDVYEHLIGAHRRSWWRQRLLSVIWIAGALVALAVITFILLVMNGINRDPDPYHHAPRFLHFLDLAWRGLGAPVLLFGTAAFALAVFYRTAVVHPRLVRRRVVPGTAVALTLGTLVSVMFATYVRTIGHYAVYYGSLATVAVILLWLYLTSLAILVGAEVNAQLEGVRDPQPGTFDEAL